MIPVLTTTGHVLIAIAMRPDSRVRDIATAINVTERTVLISISQLADAGVISVEKTGRRNLYKVNLDHQVPVGPVSLKICDLVELVANSTTADTTDDDYD
jgi:DNA-binding transcriptional ArsR family regulator